MQSSDNQRPTRPELKGASVLLIDDEPDILTILKRSLEIAGISSYGFTDPTLAVQHFKNNADNYDILVTDVRMPTMNGFDVVREIRKIRPDIKIAFSTSFEINATEFSRLLPSTKIEAFIKKPVRPSEFASMIDGLLRQS